MQYTHLTKEERIKIECCLDQGYSISEIAEKLGRSKSTISRELRRNVSKRGPNTKQYRATKAQSKYEYRLYKKPKRAYLTESMKQEIQAKIKDKWSPEIISGRTKLEGRDMVSYETIYQWIYMMQRSNKRKNKEYKELWRYLIQSKRKRRKRSHLKDQRGTIPNRIGIDKRPASAQNRSRKGHLETDLIIGKGQASSLLVMTDRKLRYTLIKKLSSRKSKIVRKTIQSVLKKIPWVKTMTFDNDLSFSEHGELGIKTYFTRPYCSQDKGSVENKNKVIRMKYDKSTDFNNLTDQKIDKLEKWINNRPMKMFKFKTPTEILKNNLYNCVALKT